MAWPLDSAPRGLHRDRWLECNGQTVDSNKYPRLAKLMNNVPDYRGLFLRGLGKIRTDDSYYGTADHASDVLGTVQGDAAREMDGQCGYMIYGATTSGGDGGGAGFHPTGSSLMSKKQPFWHPEYEYSSVIYSYALPYSNYSNNEYISTSFNNDWYNALTKYEYSLSGDKESGYSLTRTEVHPQLDFRNSSGVMNFDVSRIWPVSHEFRPINTAVRYMIKAK